MKVLLTFYNWSNLYSVVSNTLLLILIIGRFIDTKDTCVVGKYKIKKFPIWYNYDTKVPFNISECMRDTQYVDYSSNCADTCSSNQVTINTGSYDLSNGQLACVSNSSICKSGGTFLKTYSETKKIAPSSYYTERNLKIFQDINCSEYHKDVITQLTLIQRSNEIVTNCGEGISDKIVDLVICCVASGIGFLGFLYQISLYGLENSIGSMLLLYAKIDDVNVETKKTKLWLDVFENAPLLYVTYKLMSVDTISIIKFIGSLVIVSFDFIVNRDFITQILCLCKTELKEECCGKDDDSKREIHLSRFK